MSHRTQITLTDEQYKRLQRESHETGLDFAELIRRAVDRAYGTRSVEERAVVFDQTFGAWVERDDGLDGESYVETMRRGLGRRLAG